MPIFEIQSKDGKTYEVDAPDQKSALSSFASFSGGSKTQQAPEPNWFDRAKAGTDQALEGFSTTARSLGAEGTADTLSGLIETPEDYKSGFESFVEPEGGFDANYLDDAMAEQAPNFAGSMASRVAGAGAGAAVAGPPGAVAGAILGPTIFEIGQQLGPSVMARAKNNGREEPNWEDWLAAAGTSTLSGALNAIGVGKLAPLNGVAGAVTKAGKRTALEGSTEGAQSVVQQTGESLGTEAGLNVDPKQALGEGIVGGGTGGVGSSASSATSATAKKALDKVRQPYDVYDEQSTIEVAKQIKNKSEKLGFPLTDTRAKEKTNETVKVLNSVHDELLGKISGDILRVRHLVKQADDDTQDTLRSTFSAAGNKLKGLITNEQLDVLESVVGSTKAGQNLVRNIKLRNALTREFFMKDRVGGVSQYTDQLNPLSFKGGLMGTIGTIGAHTALGPVGLATPAAQVGVMGVGRGIDAVTGRRHPVAKNVRDFASRNAEPFVNTGLDTRKHNEMRQLEDERRKVAERTAKVEERQTQERLFKDGVELAKAGTLTPQWLAENRDQIKGSQYRTFLDTLDKQGQADVKAHEKRIVEERKAIREELLKTATRLADTGALTKSWIEENVDFLTPGEHKRLLDTVNKAGKAALDFRETMSKQQKAEASENLKNLTTAMFRFGKQRQKEEQAEATQAEKNAKQAAKASKALTATQSVGRAPMAPRTPKKPKAAPEAPQGRQEPPPFSERPEQTYIEFPDAHAAKTAKVQGMEQQALEAMEITSRPKVAQAIYDLVSAYRSRIKNDPIGRVRLYKTLRNELDGVEQDRFDDVVWELVHAFHAIEPKRPDNPEDIPF